MPAHVVPGAALPRGGVAGDDRCPDPREWWRRLGPPFGNEPKLTDSLGRYATEAYDSKPDVDFTPLREQDLTAAGLGQAA
ncbi:hypothetical protein ACIREO_21900 [Streptomyces sp. NPDC102441]|uniref:hypothetical protein n=1 Tax=Streptomyces sp. NPDC102441 TaxID=3366176 RepID=UPI00381FD47B